MTAFQEELLEMHETLLLLKTTLDNATKNPILGDHVSKAGLESCIDKLEDDIKNWMHAMGLNTIPLSPTPVRPPPRKIPRRGFVLTPPSPAPTAPAVTALVTTAPTPAPAPTHRYGTRSRSQRKEVQSESEFEMQLDEEDDEEEVEDEEQAGGDTDDELKLEPQPKKLPFTEDDIYSLARYLATPASSRMWGTQKQLDWAGYAKLNTKRDRCGWRNWYVAHPQRRARIDKLSEQYRKELEEEDESHAKEMEGLELNETEVNESEGQHE